MPNARRLARLIAIAAIPALLLAAGTARAGASHPDFLLSCDNGRSYPIYAKAVSDAGDLVTGTIVTGHRHAHIRLIPMGVGYRYAALGLWLDGLRGDAELNFGKHHRVACTVSRV
jgi:hypothetical protein